VGALGAGATLDLQVTGRGGVPAEATSVVLNVTALEQRNSLSFITVFPTGTARPNASSLNPSPGAPPAPNAVTATIGVDGKVSFFTLQGPVHLLVDVVGYYAPHDHDDRYYTKAQVDAKFAVTGRVALSGPAFGSGTASAALIQDGCMRSSTTGDVLVANVDVPLGATIVSISGHMFDNSANNGNLRLVRLAGNSPSLLAQVASTGAASSVITYTTNLATPERVDSTDYFFLEYTGENTLSQRICGAIVNYTIPAGIGLGS
jgi:hypothetical protein